MVDRMKGRDKKILSKSGKEILLKIIAQALPNYVMSVFLLQQEVCSDLEKAMCRFWWKTSYKKDRSIHWMSWINMYKAKMAGGLVFLCIRDFNIAKESKFGDYCQTLID